MGLTRSELHKLGFEPSRSYEHDHFITARFEKCRVTIEKTYDKNQDWKQVSCEVIIGDEYADIDSVEKLRVIDEIFNK